MSAFIYALNNADVIRVDGGPLLTSFEHDEDDEVVTFRWVDEEDQTEVVIPREGIASVEYKGNGFLVSDVDGEPVKIEVFSLVPEYPVPPKLREGWLRVFDMADKEKIIHYAALEAVMDNLVDDFIGGHAGCSANNEGYLGQIEALYRSCRGRPAAIVCGLARRLSNCTSYSYTAWEAVLDNPTVNGSLAEALRQHAKAA